MRAMFSEYARKMIKQQNLKAFKASTVLSLIVDTEGYPKAICVERSAPFDLDQQSIATLEQYRFEPATKNGQPVAVRIHIQLDYRLY
jgi:outer membrane biosynthesis protein TonB